ncbi:sensor histidine kinase [Paraburkholderia terrae]|uniref:sensor histidine kinase n=1 Tax=Paraburkholderia terrae TaxID=311230 RepID=UPI001E3D6AC7|nr:histidine kinase dimerization/phosphoacceptor domain -containing protein [Paraburkholderia terrae]
MEKLPSSEILLTSMGSSASRAARQHELVVCFGQAALTAHNLTSVLNEACRTVADGLGSHFVKVLRYVPEHDHLLLVAGVGWSPAEIGFARLSADNGSPAGYAIANGKAVLSNHLASELRFRTPILLERYGIKRAINVPIRGVPSPFGVLEADSPDEEAFIASDIAFVEGVANIIAMSAERLAAEAGERRSEELSTDILYASPDPVTVMTEDGVVQSMNARAMSHVGVTDVAAVQGVKWATLWPAQFQSAVEAALAHARTDSPARFEAPIVAADGAQTWWDVSVSKIEPQHGVPGRLVAVSRDVTERHEQEARLAALISDQEQQLGANEAMMKEVHHRVRNSLQLVQTLLGLQGNLAPEPAVKAQLKAAAVRVMTVGSVHQRLYQDNGSAATDAARYLQGLITDLQAVIGERPIELVADPIIVPAVRLSPLGLITAELVTNSVKYGRGKISVSLRADAPDSALLSVLDEGHGLPDTFPSPEGTGLGLRLVQTYSGFGRDALSVDRSVPYSKIDVRFRL